MTTPVLRQLRWFSVQKRADFKIATLVYCLLSGMAPAYLTTDCQPSSEAVVVSYVLPDMSTCVFVCSWNSLPAGLIQTDISYEQFKQLQKAYLFGC